MKPARKGQPFSHVGSTAQPERLAGEPYDVAAWRRAIARPCDQAFPAPEPLARREGELVKQWRARLTDEQRAQLAA